MRQEIATLRRQNATLRQHNEQAAPTKLARKSEPLKAALKKVRERRERKRGYNAATAPHAARRPSLRPRNPAQKKRLDETCKIVNSLAVCPQSSS